MPDALVGVLLLRTAHFLEGLARQELALCGAGVNGTDAKQLQHRSHDVCSCS